MQILRFQLAIDYGVVTTACIVYKITTRITVKRAMRQLQCNIVFLGSQMAGNVSTPAAKVDAMQAGVQLDAIAAALEAIAVYGLWRRG